MKDYLDQITKILNAASSDDDLSTQDYATLCFEVAEDAQSRGDAAQSDVDASEE